jgi:hypothetical protein
MRPRRKTASVLICLIAGLTAAALVCAPDREAAGKPVKLPETFSANAQVKGAAGAAATGRSRSQPSNLQKPVRPVR